MIRYAAFFAVGLVACWAAPAMAQYSLPLPSAAVPSDRPLSATDKARDLMNQYGICVVNEHFGAVKRALSLQDDGAIDKALIKFATDDCLVSGKLTMSEPLFRGAVFRAMYIRDFGTKSREALEPVNNPKGKAVNAGPAVDFGDCVVRLSPDGARTLVMASPDTPGERDAVQTLRQALADCLPPKQQVRFTLWGLQATLSEALYKRTVALTKADPAPATAKSGG